MSAFYILFAETCVEDYVAPGPEIETIRAACAADAWQFLTHEPLHVPLAEDSGTLSPDFLMAGNGAIPLASPRMAAALTDAGVKDYDLWRQPVYLEDAELGISERYELLLPPAIQALDTARSTYEERTYDHHVIRTATDIVIDPAAVGRLQYFRLRDVTNKELIITEHLKETLAIAGLENVHFSALKDQEA